MSFCLIILAGGNSHRFGSNIGKPYQKIVGKSLLIAPISKAGVDLSQPPIKTTPSIG